jgi:hypothetical protein
MGIYDGDYSVPSILEDCKAKPREFPRSSLRSGRVVEGVDLDMLNERISTIPVAEIRQRRARMNIFHQEILVSADPDRGISFNSLLMILAHYNVINDTKSLRYGLCSLSGSTGLDTDDIAGWKSFSDAALEWRKPCDETSSSASSTPSTGRANSDVKWMPGERHVWVGLLRCRCQRSLWTIQKIAPKGVRSRWPGISRRLLP